MADKTAVGRRLYCLALLALIAIFCLPPAAASAKQSELVQEIREPDCTVPGECAMKAPTITSVDRSGNKPIVLGTYDAVFSKYLRVIFGERTYAFGTDKELTTDGNSWRLDLSGLEQPLAPGAYRIVVEAEGYDGAVLTAETVVILTPLSPANRPAPEPLIPDAPDEIGRVPVPMDLQEVRREVSLIPLLVTVVFSLILFLLSLLLGWRRRKERPDDER